jgi:hypothetical protein
LFTTTEWEDLYVNVETIRDCEPGNYMKAWGKSAEGTGKTAEQWKQYFERVVLPQWTQDLPARRAKVEQIVRERQNEEAEKVDSGSETEEEPQEPTKATEGSKSLQERTRSNSEDSRFDQYLENRSKGKEPSGYTFYARERKWGVWNDSPGLDYSK